MSESIIIYNQPEQKLLNLSLADQDLTQVDLSTIALSDSVDVSHLMTPESFALVFDGKSWASQTYMQWEDLRINEALKAVKNQFAQPTQDILTHFVSSMDVKYQGKKSWVELLDELGKEIEGDK